MMAWRCKCGNESEPNPKGVIGLTMLEICFKCNSLPELKISPHKLYDMANGDKEGYKELLFSQGHLKNVATGREENGIRIERKWECRIGTHSE